MIENVMHYIDEHSKLYLDLLFKITSQPSISAINQGIAEMATMVKDEIERLGAKTQLVKTDGYDIVYGEIITGKKRTITFYNHYDVQPPEPLDEWLSDPFTPTIVNDKVFARGIADNKGSLLARICAIDAMRKVCGELPVNIKFIVEGEEEVGSPNLNSFREQHPEKIKTDAIIWEGGKRDIDRGPLQLTLGFKGICYLELRCETAKSDSHSMNAGIVPNAAWRLIEALNSMRDTKTGKVLIKDFYRDIKPISQLEMRYLETLDLNEGKLKDNFGISKFNGGLSGMDLKQEFLYGPTCNIAGFYSGWTQQGAKTVLPAKAVCKMDFRLVHGQSVQGVFEQVKSHLYRNGYNDIDAVLLSGKEPYSTDANHPIVKASIDSATEVYGLYPSIYLNSPGTTAMGEFCGPDSIAAISFGVDHVASNIHAPNENIYIEDFIKAIKMTALTIEKFSKY